jgi:hypothetical protein
MVAIFIFEDHISEVRNKVSCTEVHVEDIALALAADIGVLEDL